MKIYIIRHGESQATRDPTLFARMDPTQVPLTQWGYEQAVDTGKCLDAIAAKEGRKLHVYHSPYLRIVQSKDGFMQAINPKHIAKVEESALLREREHGRFNGLDQQMQRKLEPELCAKLYDGNLKERYTTPMPGGESVRDVQYRMKAFMLKIAAETPPGEDVVIITHGGNCRALEQALTHDEATWLCDFHPPGTGDIILVNKPTEEPGTSQLIHQGKKRTPSMPSDYKAHTFGTAPART